MSRLQHDANGRLSTVSADIDDKLIPQGFATEEDISRQLDPAAREKAIQSYDQGGESDCAPTQGEFRRFDFPQEEQGQTVKGFMSRTRPARSTQYVQPIRSIDMDKIYAAKTK